MISISNRPNNPANTAQTTNVISSVSHGGRGADIAIFIVANVGAVRGLIDQPNVAGFCTVGPLGQVAVAPCFTRDENLAPGMPP